MIISKKAQETTERLEKFMDKHVYPNNDTYHKQIEDFGDNRWQIVPIIEDLKKEAKKEDQEIINDLIKAAYNNAKENLKKKSAEELSKVTGGMNLPLDFKLPF